MDKQQELEEKLWEKARTVRKHVLEMTSTAGSGHPGGSLSITDVLVTLYFAKMKYDPKNPCVKERDLLVLSKGHAAPALYATLAEAGFFPKEELKSLRKLESKLQGHPERCTPGIEVATGSLGQGLSIANGLGMAAKLNNEKHRVYCVLGDGECDEGQVWEAASSAAHFKLDNITAIIDWNKLQLDGPTNQVQEKRSLEKKFDSFGWHSHQVNGHDHLEILNALNQSEKNKPTAIIADTIKGKGISFMEHQVKYHGKTLNEEELALALSEINKG